MVFPTSKKTVLYSVFFIVVLIIACTLRIPELDRRPMHTDEAVQAVKFGMLLKDNFYQYDRTEYHGPTLYYLTLIPARLESAADLTEIDESTLRIVPAFSGIMLIVLLLLLVNDLGWPVVTAAGLLTALSPAMAFYSRYYIQETLLVFFTFAAIVCGYRYLKRRRIVWAVLAGICFGLSHATKETFIIAAGAMACALVLLFLTGNEDTVPRRFSLRNVNYRHISVAVVAALVVSALLYSSFFTNPAGIRDSYLTYTDYMSKAALNEIHAHPWYYYFKLLIFPGDLSRPVWSEFFIVLLAAAGAMTVFLKKGAAGVDFIFLRFIAFYTLIMVAVYSVIPYKTPWIMLGFFHGLILLAGAGMTVLLRAGSRKTVRIPVLLLIVAGCAHLITQSYLANYRYYAVPANPYVYAHTSDDVYQVINRIEDVAAVHPDGKKMYIEVICPEHDYWPLPWYLRSYPNTGWWEKVNMDVPAAPVIIASPEAEPDLLKKLYDLPVPGKRDLYVPLFDTYTELRPAVELRGYIIKDLWDAYRLEKN
ncbi:flippase activity-associated protein Agl23 [candidate division KSB1 bacterium]